MSPRVGVGLDAQYADEYPGGLVGFCAGLRPALSHLSIVSLRSEEEAHAFRRDCAGPLPIVHHLSAVAPADPGGPDLRRFAELDGISRALGALWSCEDVGIWSLGPRALPYFTAPLLSREGVEHVAAGVREMLRRGSVPFAAENPSFTIAAGELSLGAYFRALASRTGCDLVADLSHVYSYALCSGADPLAVADAFPMEPVVELHVAGGRVSEEDPRRYVDSHSDPILPEVLELVERVAARAPRLRAVTYEIGVGLDREAIERDLARIEAALERAGWAPRLREGARG
ncbi:MAG TPA: DUF692 family protein [Polyangiaceae bacterium LLY-WYZ-15_(1-7)]|nr:DUF692 family protein [Polyangiaceae bacterium LLY-WYZ-15_(1-7)]HJL09939.1 DUF692 family protein [Polyangiaceae bacterium LLY-WYZ-15_(1-7)]HJL22910.1 DUF692 family protein [Polyangiaceae bacterium LLY-WYZ-15_(1-7)]HJL32170.1 DUF692 family protein [Polyangiaceae bacterium LLY-WYZ-15_(1-7)]HJL36328.1 DUF692 family protein [Polyangiaceae bacterium LLY-WYZ-15_(1-7)]